ncbi:hypothetical protein DI005_20405 [Prauserella sp. PE36]|nr:hypothetical protein DI005_20405 [Prauserella sp. PE36]
MLAERSRLGVVRAAVLQEAELQRSTVYRRCLPGGPWQRLLPGIILMQSSAPTDEQLAVAALLYGGPDSLLTGVEACWRHGLRVGDLRDRRLHLLVPHKHKLLSSGFVIVERTHRMPLPVFRAGLPLAPTRRAALDAARLLRAEEPAAKLLIEAMQRGSCTVDELSEELEQGGQRGSAIPRRLLKEIAQLRSVAELHARHLVRKLSVGPTHWNASLYGPAGQYVGCPDAWWDDVGLAWEIDSVDFHFSRFDYARTLQRNTKYAAAGVTVVQTLPSRLLHEPGGVLAELEAAYRAAAARPRPPVRVEAVAA